MMQPVDTGSVEGALTLLYAAACLLGLVTLLMPMDPEIDISGQFAVALAAGVVAVGLHLARTLPRLGPMALVATGTVMTTAGIHFTAGVPSSASLFFLWIALFAFYFFSPRQAAAQMVLIGACYAAVIVLTPPPFPAVAHWVTTVGAMWMAGWFVGMLKGRLTRNELEAAHILDTAHDAFVSVDERGTVLAWNAQAQALFGWSTEEARGQELALADAARTGRPLALALLDLDHFKAYNDRFGHQVGDRLLRGAAAAWQRDVRAGDLLARYGGEEFGLVMPGCDLDAAGALVERLRCAIPDGVTCSAGLVVWDGLEVADALVARADGALYAAKHAGRDQLVAA